MGWGQGGLGLLMSVCISSLLFSTIAVMTVADITQPVGLPIGRHISMATVSGRALKEDCSFPKGWKMNGKSRSNKMLPTL
jgi:hypothetical protein